MARGSKPGERRGGRQKGVPNKRTAERVLAMTRAASEIEALLPGAFEGDAHAFLMSIYKDPEQPIELRTDCAKAAIRYEKPALSSVDAKHSGEIATGGIDAPPRSESYEEWHARRQRELAAVGASTGASASRH